MTYRALAKVGAALSSVVVLAPKAEATSSNLVGCTTHSKLFAWGRDLLSSQILPTLRWLISALGPKTALPAGYRRRSEEHTSELQSLMRISYAVFCLKKKNERQCKTTRCRWANIKNYNQDSQLHSQSHNP